MANDVQVEIGAKIDGLVDGVNEAKSKISEISESASKLTESFGEVGAKILEVFAIGGIAEFLKKEMELGEETLRMSKLLGVSTEEIGGLRVAAEASGTSLETVSMALERMRLNIERSTRDGLNPMAQALRNLNLSANDFKNASPEQSLRLMMEAASRFGNETGALRDNIQLLVGRNQALVAAIMEGREEWDKNVEAGKKATGMTKEQAEQLRDANTQWVILKRTVEGWGSSVGRDLNNSITQTNSLIHGQGQFVKELGENWDILKTKIKAGAEFLPNLLGLGKVIDEIASKKTFLPNFVRPEQLAQAADAIVRTGAAWQGTLKPVTEYSNQLQTALSYMKQLGATGVEGVKPSPAPPDFGAKERLAAEIKEQEAEVDKARETFELKKAWYEREVAQNKETQQQMIANVAASEKQMTKEIVAAYDVILNMAGLTEEQRVDFHRKADAAIAKDAVAQIKAQTDAAKVVGKEWQSVYNTVASGFNSQISGLLHGTETFSAAMIKSLDTIITKLIEAVAEALLLKAAMAAFNPLGAGLEAPASGLLGSVFKAIGGIASHQEGTMYAAGGLAVLHPGEMVIPPSFSDQIRAGTASLGGGGGGNTNNLNLTMMDTSGFRGWLRSGGGKVISEYFNQNPNSRPSY